MFPVTGPTFLHANVPNTLRVNDFAVRKKIATQNGRRQPGKGQSHSVRT
jgi:hypothetical protein